MTAQLGLFTNVHRSDPVSSFEAAVVSEPVRQTHIDGTLASQQAN
jgi:hypothetical protein